MLVALFALIFACSPDPAAPTPTPPEMPPAPVAAAVPTLSPLDRAQAIVGDPDRTEADVVLDAGRKPAELLALLDLPSGAHVAEIGAGGGYSAELLARAVGSEGRVWGQNAPFVLERFAEKPWSERLARPVMAPVRRLDTPFDAPFPADFEDQGQLDLVLNVLFYHDTVWQEVDRAAMNAGVMAALKPGGRYVIVDHAARPEDGLTVTQTLHRIAEDALRADVLAAGFELVSTADFLRVPEDTKDWSASPGAAGEKRGQSDRFVLVFRKPLP